jgi:sugar O-acyltransferase (sialic acid O-acetyltransferase NeuD family)
VEQLPILLIGAGGHARVCIDVIEQEGRYAVAGLVGLADQVGDRILGYPVLGVDADIPALRKNYACALVAVGQIKTPELRIRLFGLLEQMGFTLPTLVSPRAYVSKHAKVGAGTIVMHNAIVNAGASIGYNCILNSQSLVEHDAVIGDHCHISTAAIINGGAHVGRGTFIGSGSIVREMTRVGERSVIGMGQRILGNCESGTWVPLGKEPS